MQSQAKQRIIRLVHTKSLAPSFGGIKKSYRAP